MIIKKILNNNFIIVTEDSGEEVIVSGAGVGYKTKIGDKVRSNVQIQLYNLKNSEKEQIYTILEKLDEDILEISRIIVKNARQLLKYSVTDFTTFVLADHVMNAVKRKKKGQITPNLLLNEIAQLYPQEYQIGVNAIQFIYTKTNVVLPKDEAGYIALHILNGSSIESAERAIQIAEIAKQILLIVRNNFQDISITSVEYNRFITHLNLFAKRVFSKESLLNNLDNSLYNLVFSENKKLNQCISSINNFMKENYQYLLSKEEKLYLGLHIKRMVQ